MRTFRDLLVWQKAHRLVLDIYRLTRAFPPEERFGLIPQMRRAAVSIAANVTEGHQRKSKPEFLRFLDIAHSSLDELKYYLLLTKDLDYGNGSVTHFMSKAEEVGRMLNGLKAHVRKEVRDD